MMLPEMENKKNIDPRDAILDKPRVWGEISRRCRAADRRRTVLRAARYAAAVAVPLMVAGAAWWHVANRTAERTDTLTATARDIAPGYKRAMIWTQGRDRIDISGIGRDTLIRHEGYNIRLDRSGTVFYEPLDGQARQSVASTVFVPRGGEHQLVLSDGTRVWLNSDTELRFPVPFTDGERRVEMRGEAFFDVAHDPDHPFRVTTGEMTVTALGTRFNVKNYDGEPVQATLARGSVRVDSGQGGNVLSPGQQLVLGDGGVQVRDVDPGVCTAWIEGRFCFDGTPLSEIAAQMERWYDISVVFADGGMRGERFTGVIERNNSADDVMRTLEKITGLRWNIDARTIVIY
jgi:ferric-dicitrate binding protein FerR (iron transport regulator)